jgi:hypothetical protein
VRNVTTKEEIVLEPRTPEERRELAIKRVKDKHDFKIHLTIYIIVNTMLVLIWAFAHGSGQRTFFWPVFPMAGWGIGVAINAYVAYHGDVITEREIEREMRNLGG